MIIQKHLLPPTSYLLPDITVAGAGSGSFLHLTPEVKDALENSEVIVASSRFLNLIPRNKKFIELKNFSDTFAKVKSEAGKILILVSGDAGLYSLLPLLKKNFENIKVLPGISSLQILCARACESWNYAKILSGHGRNLSAGEFLNVVERNEKTILFCDKKISPQWACENLKNFSNVEIFIGSNLGSADEIFLSGSPKDFAEKNFPELSIILIKNREIYEPSKIHLRDKDFLREKNIVMTNESVRAVIFSRLELEKNSLLWDIGAGSGSVSVSAAYENIAMEVHAVEKNPDAVKLISRNAAKFHLHNIKIHEGKAGDVIKFLPLPSHIFIGGSGGELRKIFSLIKNPARVVLACVTLETFHEAYEIMSRLKNFEAVQISAVSSQPLSSNKNLTLMRANNPVMILSAEL